jgi:hypothetical protein
LRVSDRSLHDLAHQRAPRSLEKMVEGVQRKTNVMTCCILRVDLRWLDFSKSESVHEIRMFSPQLLIILPPILTTPITVPVLLLLPVL